MEEQVMTGNVGTKTCPFCGEQISIGAKKCKHCGEWLDKKSFLNENTEDFSNIGEKSFTKTILFAFFLGMFGAHRFYTGYVGIGIAQLFTLGGLGIWSLTDFCSICRNKYKDVYGLNLKNYDKNLAIGLWIVMILFLCAKCFAD